ncbi:hypothetical protein [Paraburkholderia aspalathi]|uniref:hypothetical protein n=1 Tax=Paraburkholderia aspalathi TaxID=1324617 RepID=UPI001B28B5EA|nr:hypothetical protein [Paraburkholderia aspalathi]CAE6754689.1 hypothetical protein R20943_03082 [Paraburkholderia aspalathi]
MDPLQAVYVASKWLDIIRIQLARHDLSKSQKDAVLQRALEQIEKVLGEAKATNPVPVSLSLADKVILEKVGPDALKAPTDAKDKPTS